MTLGPQATAMSTDDRPFFSIITAMWNRANTIGRCIESCLCQSFGSFEHIIVDDGSSDDSTSVVQSYTDPRVKLVRRPTNGGPGAARNSGIRQARGVWVLTLDSDDALLPEALATVADHCRRAAPDVGLLGFSYEVERKGVSPIPCPPPQPLDYAAYLHWFDSVTRADHVTCHRREVFEQCLWTECLWGSACFHFNVAKQWKVCIFPVKVGKVYLGAANRLSKSSDGRARMQLLLRWAPKQAEECHNILALHGYALRSHAPQFYRETLFGAVLFDLLCSHRGRAWRVVPRLMRRKPVSPVTWLVLLTGTVHRRLLAWSWVYGGTWKRRSRKD
jgi:hypothetical protein